MKDCASHFPAAIHDSEQLSALEPAPQVIADSTAFACAATCEGDVTCHAWTLEISTATCFLLSAQSSTIIATPNPAFNSAYCETTMCDRPCQHGFGSSVFDFCAECGSEGQVYCDGVDEPLCQSGFAADDSQQECTECGGDNQLHCVTGNTCRAGFVEHDDETCEACGAAGQPVCTTLDCARGSVQVGTQCVSCGHNEAPPCLAPEAECDIGLGVEASADLCVPCGEDNMPTCTSHERTCYPGFGVGDDGRCHTCGREGQVTCLAPEPACKQGFTQAADGTCVSGDF